MTSADDPAQETQTEKHDERRQVECCRAHPDGRDHAAQRNQNRIGQCGQESPKPSNRMVGRNIEETENDSPEQDQYIQVDESAENSHGLSGLLVADSVETHFGKAPLLLAAQ